MSSIHDNDPELIKILIVGVGIRSDELCSLKRAAEIKCTGLVVHAVEEIAWDYESIDEVVIPCFSIRIMEAYSRVCGKFGRNSELSFIEDGFSSYDGSFKNPSLSLLHRLSSILQADLRNVSRMVKSVSRLYAFKTSFYTNLATPNLGFEIEWLPKDHLYDVLCSVANLFPRSEKSVQISPNNVILVAPPRTTISIPKLLQNCNFERSAPVDLVISVHRDGSSFGASERRSLLSALPVGSKVIYSTTCFELSCIRYRPSLIIHGKTSGLLFIDAFSDFFSSIMPRAKYFYLGGERRNILRVLRRGVSFWLFCKLTTDYCKNFRVEMV